MDFEWFWEPIDDYTEFSSKHVGVRSLFDLESV